MFFYYNNKMTEQIKDNNILETIKDINFVEKFNSLYFIISLIKEYYLRNQVNIDAIGNLIFFMLVLFEWFNLSLIHNLYFLALVYMTVNAVGNHYNKLSKTENDIEILNEFILISNNWLTYSSLLICHKLNDLIDYLMGGGISIKIILHLGKLLLYMYYTKQFCNSLNKVKIESRDTYIGDEMAKNASLPSCVKHLINIISINNIFCNNIFIINHRILLFIDYRLTSSFEMLLYLYNRSISHVSQVQSTNWTQLIKSYMYIPFGLNVEKID